MQGAGTEPFKLIAVKLRGIAFMAREVVAGITFIRIYHQSVSRNFCDNRRGGDRKTTRVTLNDILRLTGEVRQFIPVN